MFVGCYVNEVVGDGPILVCLTLLFWATYLAIDLPWDGGSGSLMSATETDGIWFDP